MRGAGIISLIIGAGILILFFYYVTILYAYLFSRSGHNILYRDFYECGFKMLPDTRIGLDLQFSVLGLIFLIYDMEIILVVPLVVNILSLPLIAYWLLIIVLIILAVSYLYEWENYALQWGFN